MRDFTKVSTRLWQSRKFSELKSDDAKLLYLYFHTCVHGNSVGCFYLPTPYACADLNWTEARYKHGVDTLSASSLVGVDWGESVIRIANFLTFSPLMNVSHAKGSIKIALSLPKCKERYLLFKDLLKEPLAKNDWHIQAAVDEWDRVSTGCGHNNTETETETKTETKTETETQRPAVIGEKSEKKLQLFSGQEKKKKPTEKISDSAKEILRAVPNISEEAIESYIRYRKTTKTKSFSAQAAKLVTGQLLVVVNQGGDPNEALATAELSAWQGFKAEWYFNTKGNQNGQQNRINGQETGQPGRMGKRSKIDEIADRAARLTARRQAER